eukprot:TRINITY_DN11923_c0_g1_i3.p1 TRINITY_DN11923_c0_g1~~TRINITY_DN11923_c0_g1_i3.p1  ORF type:complete len:929 (+),score=237.88 TRINITY_DN11923_c0_g1_i3:339-2789(+)
MATQYFMRLLTHRRFKEAQAQALSMSKAFKGSQHKERAVLCMLFQAKEAVAKGQAALATSVLLPLAERMLQSVIDAAETMSIPLLRLQMMLYEQAGKHQQIVDSLQSSNCPLAKDNRERCQLLLKTYQQLEQHAHANAFAQEMLTNEPDDWIAYLAYFDSLAALERSPGTIPEDISPHTSWGQARDYLQSLLQTEQAKPSPCRGPFLALLEYHKRSVDGKLRDADFTEDVLPVLQAYTTRFGSKLCCVPDLKSYLACWQAEMTPEVLVSFTPSKVGNDDEPEGKKILRNVQSAQMERLLGRHASLEPEELVRKYQEYHDLYQAALPAGAGLESSELQYADGYAMLCGYLAFQHHVATEGNPAQLLEAATLLRTATSKSPAASQLRLLLIRVLLLLGLAGEAWEHWQKLEIKQMQLDSIGYFMTDHFVRMGNFNLALKTTDTLLRFITGAMESTRHALARAIQHQTYHMVEQFFHMLLKLKLTLNAPLSLTDAIRCHMLAQCKHWSELPAAFDLTSSATLPNDEELSASDPDVAFRDQREVTLMDDREPLTEMLLADVTSTLTTARKAYTRLRCHQMSMLKAAVYNKAEFEQAITNFKHALAEFETAETAVPTPVDHAIFGLGVVLPRARYLTQQHREHLKLVPDMFQLLLLVRGVPEAGLKGEQLKGMSTAIQNFSAKLSERLQPVLQAVEAAAKAATNQQMLLMPNLEGLVDGLEVIALTRAALLGCFEHVKLPESVAKPRRRTMTTIRNILDESFASYWSDVKAVGAAYMALFEAASARLSADSDLTHQQHAAVRDIANVSNSVCAIPTGVKAG